MSAAWHGDVVDRGPRMRLSRRVVVGTIAYFCLATVSLCLTRFDGGLAFIWTANALLLAELVARPRTSWRTTIAGAFLANCAATSLFGLGVAAAPWISLVNIAEAVIGAVLLKRFLNGGSGFDSIRSTATFAAVVGLAAPLATALPGAAIATLATGGLFWSNAVHWLAAHGLGTITFAPILFLLCGGKLDRLFIAATWRSAAGVAGHVAFAAAIVGVSFAPTGFPLLFLPILPLVTMTFRYGETGASLVVLLIALVGGSLTLAGHGPVYLIDGALGPRIQFFQFYLAVCVLTALPIAAELGRRRRLFRDLCASEARFRMLATRSSDAIMSTDVMGKIDYLSPSITEHGGYDAAALIGTSAAALIHPDDRATVGAHHFRMLATPDVTIAFEYRARVADGSYRWFESHTRGVVDEDGAVRGVLSAIRDVTERKSAEATLAHAAVTDPLTGVPNRRVLSEALDTSIGEAAHGRNDAFCAVIDFDHFKQINDRLGHDAGDRALQAFAQLATDHLGPGELVARVGGEEFALLLRRPGMGAALEFCEGLVAAVEALSTKAICGTPIALTISIGLSQIDGTAGSRAVLANADGALYRAKRAGRNRVVVARGTDRRSASEAVPLALAG